MIRKIFALALALSVAVPFSAFAQHDGDDSPKHESTRPKKPAKKAVVAAHASPKAVNGLYVMAYSWPPEKMAAELLKEAAASAGCVVATVPVGLFIIAENIPLWINKVPDAFAATIFPKQYEKAVANAFAGVKRPESHEEAGLSLGGGPLSSAFMRLSNWANDGAGRSVHRYTEAEIKAANDYAYASSSVLHQEVLGKGGACSQAATRALILSQVNWDKANGVDRRIK